MKTPQKRANSNEVGKIKKVKMMDEMVARQAARQAARQGEATQRKVARQKRVNGREAAG